jgi:hypothetical protein
MLWLMIRLGFELLDGLDGYVLRVVEITFLRSFSRGYVLRVVEKIFLRGDFTALPDSPENCAGKFLSPASYNPSLAL